MWAQTKPCSSIHALSFQQKQINIILLLYYHFMTRLDAGRRTFFVTNLMVDMRYFASCHTQKDKETKCMLLDHLLGRHARARSDITKHKVSLNIHLFIYLYITMGIIIIIIIIIMIMCENWTPCSRVLGATTNDTLSTVGHFGCPNNFRPVHITMLI